MACEACRDKCGRCWRYCCTKRLGVFWFIMLSAWTFLTIFAWIFGAAVAFSSFGSHVKLFIALCVIFAVHVGCLIVWYIWVTCKVCKKPKAPAGKIVDNKFSEDDQVRTLSNNSQDKYPSGYGGNSADYTPTPDSQDASGYSYNEAYEEEESAEVPSSVADAPGTASKKCHHHKCWKSKACRCFWGITKGVTFTICVGINLFVIVSFCIIAFIFMNTPKVSGTLSVPGLTGSKATVVREASGYAHITADNEHDLFFAQGVAHATDRLWQMEFQRRVASGTLSEVIGSSTLATDKFLRTLSVYEAAKKAWENASAQSKTMIQAYIDGVNSYLNGNNSLPLEFIVLGFKPNAWTGPDVYGWFKMIGYDLGGDFSNEFVNFQLMTQGISKARIIELLPEVPATQSAIVPPEEIYQFNSTAKTTSIYPNSFLEADADAAAYIPPVASRKRDFEDPTTTRPKLEHLTTEEAGTKKESSDGILYDTLHAMLQESINRGGPIDQIIEKGLGGLKGMAHASNNWVVHGSLTDTGKPYLANDPHLGLSIPPVWYHVNLKSPSWGAVGVSLVGIPGIIIGRNDKVGWGITYGGADVQDLYVMQPTPDGASYYYKGSTRAFSSRSEVIKVKKEADVPWPVRSTVYGPVVNALKDVPGFRITDPNYIPISLRWSALDDIDTSMDGVYSIGKAATVYDVKAAIPYLTYPSLCLVCADTAGNIGYFANGYLPVRAPGHSGHFPAYGNGTWDWLGAVDKDALPQMINPKRGWLMTANQRFVATRTPYYPWHLNFPNSRNGLRADRLERLFAAKIATGTKFTRDDMIAFQSDQTSLMVERFRTPLTAMSGLSTNAAAWQQKLLAWNGLINNTLSEPLVWHFWWQLLAQVTVSETAIQFWNEPQYLTNLFVTGTAPTTSCTKAGFSSCLAYAQSKFETAVSWYVDNSFTTYGTLHRQHYNHSIFAKISILDEMHNRYIEAGGDGYTVHANTPTYPVNITISPIKTLRWDSVHGASFREIIDFSNMDSSVTCVPPGNSGVPLSTMYDKTLYAEWLWNGYLPMTQVVPTTNIKTQTLQA